MLGLLPVCAVLVAAMALWHAARHQRREAAAWITVGVATFAVQELIKLAVGRARPELWPWLVQVAGSSFPSGHAMAGTAFYPLLAWLTLRSRLGSGRLAYALGLAPAAFTGVGRCYLGVHWPSDVLAGWMIGAALSAAAVAWLGRRPGLASGAGTR